MKHSKRAPVALGTVAPRASTRARTSGAFGVLVVLALTACGFPRPADVGDDVPGDSSADPGLAIRVSPSGDDANDGLIQPVKTLKHAIGLAAANAKIATILLESGTYSISSGETFPYTVPPGVSIVGPAGGSAVLAGSTMEPGMIVDTGGIQDVDLQDFTTAVTATGTASLKNVRVLGSAIAVQAETSAKLMVDNVNIAGTPGACATGIVLIGAARLMATTLATRNLGITLDARDQSATDITNANISGDMACSQSAQLMLVVSSTSFSLRDSLLDGGSNHGIVMFAKSESFQATITNTIIRNMKRDALSGESSSPSTSFHITGGELSSNGGSGAEFGAGVWSLMGVTIRQNVSLGVYVQFGRLIMRNCIITNNGIGVDVFDNGTADFGSLADPGNNLFQGNGEAGLSIDGNFGGTHVDAIGNTWNPNVQGADAMGKYTTIATISGPVANGNGINFSIGNTWSLSR